MGSSALSAPELTARSVGRLYCEHSNMFKFVISSCLAAAVLSQYVDPEKAKILKEQRFNAGDGRFGAAYAQEDGTVYREETSADGERVGQYSYIDQAGKTITVRYSAGKDGFKILEGDHVPTGTNGQNSAPFVATQAPRRVAAAPQPQQFTQAAVQPASSDYDYYEDINPTQNTLVPNPSRTLPPPPTPTPSSTPTTPLTGTSDSTSTELASEATPEPTARVLYLLALTALGSTPSSTPSTTPTVTPRPSSLPPLRPPDSSSSSSSSPSSSSPPHKLPETSSLLENWRSTGSRTGLTSILPHSK